MLPDSPHRKHNTKYNLEGHAHFLTFSCYRRLPLLTNDLWRQWLAEAVRTAWRKHTVDLWAYRFWQAGGGHDLNVWSVRKAVEETKYCHWNPVKRGLVRDPAHWRWSSYACLELGRTDGPLSVDPWEESLIKGPEPTALVCIRPQNSGTQNGGASRVR